MTLVDYCTLTGLESISAILTILGSYGEDFHFFPTKRKAEAKEERERERERERDNRGRRVNSRELEKEERKKERVVYSQEHIVSYCPVALKIV